MVVASNEVGADNFRECVSISGDIVVVGAPLDDDAGTIAGSAFTYDKLLVVFAPTAVPPPVAAPVSTAVEL